MHKFAPFWLRKWPIISCVYSSWLTYKYRLLCSIQESSKHTRDITFLFYTYAFNGEILARFIVAGPYSGWIFVTRLKTWRYNYNAVKTIWRLVKPLWHANTGVWQADRKYVYAYICFANLPFIWALLSVKSNKLVCRYALQPVCVHRRICLFALLQFRT